MEDGGHCYLMLLVNFSYDLRDVSEFLHRKSDWRQSTVLDFTASISHKEFGNVIYPAQIDPQNTLHSTGLRKYVSEMGVLSRVKTTGGDIRELQFRELPLYWLTSVAEKHPQNCVLKNLYYFDQLWPLIRKHGLRIAIILPAHGQHFQSALRSYINKQGQGAELVCFNKQESRRESLRYYLSLLKTHWIKTRRIRRRLKSLKKTGTESSHLVCTFYPETWREDLAGDYVLHELEQLIEKETHSVKYLPFFSNPTQLLDFTNNSKFDTRVFRTYPGWPRLAQMYGTLLVIFARIGRLNFDVSGLTLVNNSALKYELQKVITDKIEYLVHYQWLDNLFRAMRNPVRVYYQDEFYISGRVISAAACRHPLVETIGVQHGIFYDAHTVYSITQEELTATRENNGLPIPSRFAVWGKFFKDHFLSNNYLPAGYVVEAGNIKYIRIIEQENFRKRAHYNSSHIRLIWCTTLKTDTIRQFRIIEQAIRNFPSVSLTIRCHPLVPLRSFIETELLAGLKPGIVSFSENDSVFEAMRKCDVVLCGSGTTIFLDAMVMKKPIFHFVNDDYYMGDLGKAQMKSIRSYLDFKRAIDELLEGKSAEPEYAEILRTDIGGWTDLINSEQTRKR